MGPGPGPGPAPSAGAAVATRRLPRGRSGSPGDRVRLRGLTGANSVFLCTSRLQVFELPVQFVRVFCIWPSMLFRVHCLFFFECTVSLRPYSLRLGTLKKIIKIYGFKRPMYMTCMIATVSLQSIYVIFFNETNKRI